jgi:hypothetical protein
MAKEKQEELKVSRAFFEKYGSKWPHYEEKNSKVAIFRE